MALNLDAALTAERLAQRRGVPVGTLFIPHGGFPPALPCRAFTCRRFATGFAVGLVPR